MKGYTTIHAGSARQALTRLRFVCQLSDTGAELPISALNTLVSESVDLVVHCARRGGTPQVTEVLAVEDLQTGPDATTFTTTDLFRRAGPGAALRWTGQLPVRATRAFDDAGIDLRVLLAAATEQQHGYQPPPQLPTSPPVNGDGKLRR